MEYRRLDLIIDVEYGTSAEEACKVLMDLIKADVRILDIKKGAKADPFVALSALKDSSIQFTIRVWVKSEDYWDVNFSLLSKIYSELPKHNIQFPYPKLDVNILNK